MTLWAEWPIDEALKQICSPVFSPPAEDNTCTPPARGRRSPWRGARRRSGLLLGRRSWSTRWSSSSCSSRRTPPPAARSRSSCKRCGIAGRRNGRTAPERQRGCFWREGGKVFTSSSYSVSSTSSTLSMQRLPAAATLAKSTATSLPPCRLALDGNAVSAELKGKVFTRERPDLTFNSSPIEVRLLLEIELANSQLNNCCSSGLESL